MVYIGDLYASTPNVERMRMWMLKGDLLITSREFQKLEGQIFFD